MADLTELQQLKNDYPQFFEKADPKIIDLAFSDELSDQITGICLENGVSNEENISKIAYRAILVLLGKFPAEGLSSAIELVTKLPTETTQKIANATNQLISYLLAQRETTESAPSQKEPKKQTPITEERPKKPEKPDVYRETVE